jgi:queuine tRNA-ribosyltransferase
MRSIRVGEVMHPGVGPLVESRELYVRQSRLEARLRDGAVRLCVYDVGLGAGSNALAARAAAERAGDGAARLELVSFERDLGALELALAHPDAFGTAGAAGQAARALLADGEHRSARTRWRLRRGELLDALAAEAVAGEAPADIVFWDPFSPGADPSLWTVAAFRALRRAAAPRCTLFTYSASTATRVALLLAGFAVGVGDAIGDKAQTTAAAVDPADLARPLDRRWLERVARADAPRPTDAPTDLARALTALPQFAAGR